MKFSQFRSLYPLARRIAILFSCLFLFFHAETLAADLGNVMPLGDSITVGVGDPRGGGYRDPLYTQLTNAGHTFQFVGTLSSSPTELLTSAGQQNHEGHGGYVIEAGTSGREGIRDNITTYLGATDPDLILLMIGTNDVHIGSRGVVVKEARSNLGFNTISAERNATNYSSQIFSTV